MKVEDRTDAFEKLGNLINAIDKDEFQLIIQRAKNENSWFTEDSIKKSFTGLGKFLNKVNIHNWVKNYRLDRATSKTIAVVMAGNIPMVGFHDLMTVLISGNSIQIKLSSKDRVLMTYIIDRLMEIEPRFRERITIVEQLKNFDAVIATGSDNSARYFDYYFSKYPHVIRKNRSSCAILSGFENDEELTALGEDVFTYFGLGCRNVSKLYVPENYDLPKLIKSWEKYQDVLLHHKYHNNYDYQKSILLVNSIPFLDSGFFLLQESEKLVSPVSVIFYEYYSTWDSVMEKMKQQQDKIQCIVGNIEHANVKIGQTQSPELWDYADQLDTLKFLEGLN